MRDVEIAIETLHSEALCLVVVKDGIVLYKSKKRGIKPLYEAVKLGRDYFEGASLADRVIGKAAAMLCVYLGMVEIHTLLISKPALEVLKNTNIPYSYDKETPFIKNRDKTGMCPIETRAQNVSDVHVLIRKIELFLTEIGK